MAGVTTMYAPSYTDSIKLWNFAGVFNYLSENNGSDTGVSPQTPTDEAATPTNAPISPPTSSLTPTSEAALGDETDYLTGANVSCSVCHKKFANIHRLQRHMISHQESDVLRRFKCDECGKAFKFKHHLKEHKRIHSGEKPFECEHCGKRFSHSGSYSSHMSSKKCQLGRSRTNGVMPRPPPQFPGSNSKRPALNGSYLPILPKDKSPTPSADLGYSSPTRPISRDSLLMSPPSLVSPGSLSSSSMTPVLNQGFPQCLSQGLQGNLHQGLSPYHPLNPLILAAQLHPQYSSFLSLTMTQAALNKAQQEGVAEEKDHSEDAPQEDVDDEDREPGELVIKEETKEEEEEKNYSERERRDEDREEPANNNEKEGMSTLKKMLESVNTTVTKQQFEEKVSSATPGTLLSNSPITDDLSCELCGIAFKSCIDALYHARGQCPRLPEVNAATERYKGRIIEGLAARLLAGNQQHQHLQQSHYPMHPAQSLYTHSRGVHVRDEDNEGDSSHVVDDEETTSDGKKVRVRSHIREEQLVVLRAHYAVNPRPKKEELITIAEKINFPVRVVQVWFQNARARDRREGRSITPTPTSYSQPSYSTSYSTPSHTTPSYTATSYAPASYVAPTSQANSKSISISPYYPSLLAPSLMYPLNGRASPTPGDGADDLDDDQPLDLSTKKSSPSASPKPASVFSDSDADSTSLAISYKSESRTPTPNSLNNNIADSKESSGLSVAGYPSLISEQHSKLAQILQGAKLGLPALYPDHLENSDKRPREDDDCDDEARKRRRDEEGGVFQCDQCDKSFNKQSSLARHKYEHSGKRPFKCDLCPKAFKHKHHLTEHSRLHTGEKPFQCDKCLKRFSHSGSYSQHRNHRYSYCKPYRPDGAAPHSESSTPVPSPSDSGAGAVAASEGVSVIVTASADSLPAVRVATPLSSPADEASMGSPPASPPDALETPAPSVKEEVVA
ncbi:zinc finger E-box-binding homeobox protein zag-1-like isoform X2 [Penaeus japonicus]|uniref:zinc finger E-box-binding homeobox protein zag-1-like isoform X2 n=1 Tax=Penaeus japonicus TaxID=27405 RepID=UPI001C7173BF|nr:zinc finger E-box-binding homeobox protein zag-1-like isoform X2 [Penaeus japonicus]